MSLKFFQTSSVRHTVHIIARYYFLESILSDRFLPRRLNIIAQYFILFVGYNAQTCLSDTATAGVAIAVQQAKRTPAGSNSSTKTTIHAR